MDKNKGIIGVGLIIAIVFGIAVIGGGAYYLGKGSNKPEVENPENILPNNENKNLPIVDNKQLNNQISTKSSSLNITCKDTPNYFIVSKSLALDTGTDILIKYKDNNKNITCDYKIQGTDFEIKDNGNSEYFYAINKNLLILDSGTGSENRGVTIYNLDTRKEVFTDTYNMDGVDNLNIKENAMTYWSTNFKQTVTKQNCPQYYNSGKFVSHISMDLSTLIKTDLNEDKCVY